MTFLPELKRLMDAATKGPWEWDGNKLWHFGSSCRKDDVDPYRYTGINYERRLDKSPTLHANKDLIAYLVKHAPALAELVDAAEKLEPYLDAIICYASTMDEHEPNRIANSFRNAIVELNKS